jgi:hypothetical protein
MPRAHRTSNCRWARILDGVVAAKVRYIHHRAPRCGRDPDRLVGAIGRSARTRDRKLRERAEQTAGANGATTPE